jgi:hypothetical protein
MNKTAPIIKDQTYCIAYNHPNKKDYYHNQDNKLLEKHDWIYAYYDLPKNKLESLDCFIRLKETNIVFVIDVQQSKVYENNWLVTFVAKDSRLYYLNINDDAEIIDPVTLIGFCRLIKPERINQNVI